MGHPAEKQKKYTSQDYLLTPEDKRYELIEGDLVMVPAPNVWHQRISGRLGFALQQLVLDNDLGEILIAPCDVVFDNETVLQPDILFISKAQQDIITDANIQGAPDLVIEIISPSSAYNDLVRKKKIYARFGVKEYWLVDPEEKTVDILGLEGTAFALRRSFKQTDILVSEMFDGLQINLVGIFK